MTKSLFFKIYGNQEDPRGNPIPYLRTTQKSQWTDKAKRYQQWKDYIRANYLDALGAVKKIDRADFGEAHDLIQKKPIRASDHKQKMSLQICFKDKTHADCDNIFKGIADALFMNDKHLVGEFDYSYVEKGVGGSILVTLEL